MNKAPETTHWSAEIDEDGLLWLHLDHASASTNVLSEEVLVQLEEHLAALESEPPRAVIFLSDKPNGFIAGADVKAFTQIESEDQALELLRYGQSLFDRIERVSCPTLSAIHGFCLGGGLELALACRSRIAREDSSTRLGLPEVRLGIHPGLGGTVRASQLLGTLPAMELMLTGRTVDAWRARRIGLVDQVVPERQFYNAARALALNPPPRLRPGFGQRLAGWAPVRPLVGSILRRRTAQKAPPDHYPAPYALIDLWQRYASAPTSMLEAEAQSVARLITGTTSRNLVRVFLLQEQLKSLARKGTFSPQHIHIVGAGTMGGDIAAWCALHGLHVTLQDRAPDYIAPALKRAHVLFRRRLQPPREVQAAQDRLIPDPDGKGVESADVVLEAITEAIEAKRALFQRLEPRMPAEALLATNTSSIPLEMLSSALSHPERLVGLHFFNPVPRMQPVEVVQGNDTNPTVAEQGTAFAHRLDKLPVPVKSTPGFLVNRILMPYLMEAIILESEGVSPKQIDRAATEFGMPMGPLLLADTVGLDICLAVANALTQNFAIEVPQRLRTLVKTGRLGRKSGRGFYRYPRGRPVAWQPSLPRSAPSKLTDRLMLPYLNEAVTALHEGVIANPELLDGAMVFATGFAPFRGGPIHYIHQCGKEALIARMEALQQEQGRRFAPHEGWHTLAPSEGTP